MTRLVRTIINVVALLFLVQLVPALVRGIKKSYSELFEHKTKVGVIQLQGFLGESARPLRQLKKFFEDPEIKAIVIKFDSPGGCAGSSQAIFADLVAYKKQYSKPVVGWVQNICASGAYYVASATDHLIATPSAFLGSVGVYIGLPHLKKFIEQLNIKYEAVRAGSHKMAGNPLLELSAEEQKMFKSLVDDTYRQFVADVASQRSKLAIANATDWAEGKVFTGTQALALGLIDEVGSTLTVEQYLRQKLNVQGAFSWIKPSCPAAFTRLFGTVDGCDDEEAENTSTLDSFVRQIVTSVRGALTSPELLSDQRIQL